MGKIRVYELARELNMANKALVEKILALGISISSHMSSLDDDAIAEIKAAIFGKKEAEIEETRVRPTIIRRRRKAAEEPAAEKPPAEVAPEEQESGAAPVQAAEDIAPAEDRPEIAEPHTAPPTAAEAAPELEAEIAPGPEAETAPLTAEADGGAQESLADSPAQPPDLSEIEPEARPLPDFSDTPADTPADALADTPADTPASPPESVASRKKKKSTAAKIISLPEKPVKPKSAKAIAPAAGAPNGQKNGDATPAEREEGRRKKGRRRVDDKPVEAKPIKKKGVFKRKEVVEGAALYDDALPLRPRKGKKGAKARPVLQKPQLTVPKAIKRRIKIDDTILLADLAKRLGIKANEIIGKLMSMGVMATLNQTIDYDTAVLVAAEFNYEVERAAFEEDTLLKSEADDPAKMVYRPPVVTIMGHVDHGKTSLLDVVRETHVTDTEAGGITQHIGAYHVSMDNGQVVFLDTPGHEAFTAMRARGAKVTDIVVLVVAADDGVMPQTVEAINHSKAAGVPIIVAINKIDKQNADLDRVQRELADHGLVSEDWGGDTIFVRVSAKKNIGIAEMLELIGLQAELLELKANPDKLARGHVIESKLDAGRGPVATLLVQEGTLHTGEAIVCGIHYGKIRAMLDDLGHPIDAAGPSMPVEILGLSGVPNAGDDFVILEDEKSAKQVSENRQHKQRSKDLGATTRLSLEKLFEQMQVGEVKDLNLILKADVHGSIEALRDSLVKLSNAEVNINVIHAATGTITESDISLAAVSDAIIMGFNVRAGAKVQAMAAEEHVDIRHYTIIYDAIKDLKDAIVGMMSSSFEERLMGSAEVRQVFHVPKVGAIAGCHVTSGKIERNQRGRIVRDGVICYDGKIASLRRFKDNVKEVQSGYECGIGIENFNDIKVGDVIECYFLEEIKPEMA